MKFLHSPSSTPRPTYAPAGCIPAVLRRLLCFHTLPTFPLDTHIKENFLNNEFHEVYCDDKLKASPGIVGKLMGLDSMPAEQFKLPKKGNCVIKAPAFVEIENDKFIILSFEGGGKDKGLRMNSSKRRTGSIEKEKARSKLNQEKPICCQSVDKDSEVLNLKKSSDLEGAEKGISRKIIIESDSENSSPVSVLEFSDHQEASYSGKGDSQSKTSNSRRKLRGDLDKNAPSLSSLSSCRNGKENVGLENKNNFAVGESKEMWEEICKMTEKDVMNSSRVQMERWKGEEFEEIGVCFELQILDQLILELLFTMT
ncbi:hypothetical protein HanOQP8_Chr05g0175471 [Helianthus annuus]|nr:hypothetical protein HanOQP8_Chr05g0175471 [Helianthus annuus]KAJ0749264.1 hypothetical protein HanLR1_Chr05g0167811 [Helianthus annuus]KAJ0921507.1 hypothetical protein HanPSC8_Chr05g0192341 [Helianthus annuus]